MHFTAKRGLLVLVSALTVSIAGASYIYVQNQVKIHDPNPPSPTSLVKFNDDKAKNKFLSDNDLGDHDLHSSSLPNTYVVKVPNNKLKNTDGASVAPRRQYRALLTPNDPIYPQWYTNNIAAPTAWDITTGTNSVTVAVIDTGFALNHEDMANRWAINSGEYGGGKESNAIDDDGNGKIDDWRGWDFANNDNSSQAGTTNPVGAGVSHGTTTSGLVGSTGNNSLGVASVNWGAKILPLQVLSDDGYGYTDSVASAINYAVARGVKVINMSLGTTADDPTVHAAVANALNSGVTVIASAGNCGDPNTYFINGCDYVGQIEYPAKYPEVFGIGAVDQNDNRASFSSYGPGIILTAPGSGTIQAPAWSQANQTSLYTGNAYGTSFSAPIVAGAVAMLYSQQPTITPSEVYKALSSASDKTAEMNGAYNTYGQGFGRLNVTRLLEYIAIPHPDGTLIYNPAHTIVYLIENGQTRFIPNEAVFNSYGFDWSKIKEPSVADLHLPAGSDLSFREGTILTSNGAIYAVDVNGGTTQKRGFSSWSAFAGLGYSTSDITWVSAGELPASNGPLISDSSVHPDGTLVFNASHTGVQLIEGSQKRDIVSGTVFSSNAFNWSRIKNPTSGDLALASGTAMSYPREGSLVTSGGAIYVIDVNGGTTQKRGFGSWNTFTGLGYSINDLYWVSVGELPSQSGTIIIY